MAEQKVGFLRMEDCNSDQVSKIAEQIREATPENYNIIVMDENISWADPDKMMEMFLSMFHFIEASCYEDKADALQALNKNQKNLKDVEEENQ